MVINISSSDFIPEDMVEVYVSMLADAFRDMAKAHARTATLERVWVAPEADATG